MRLSIFQWMRLSIICNNEFMNVCAEPSGARRNEFQRQTKSKSLQVEGKMMLF